ncbi:MAG: glucosamine-6-phosphate deaminase [Terrimicrobiaceae bacterium]
MEIIISTDPASASHLAARSIARLIKNKPDAVLGLATGSTPLMLYKELIRQHREEGLDFSRCRTFNLDEYLGLAPGHPASYHHFMWKNFFDHININPSRTHIPSGMVRGEEIPRLCANYEEEIRLAGGIDMQVLGIGSDGHIGFNEQGSSLASRTRIKTLTRRTRADNAQFFKSEDDVPHHVITMGIGTIMEAKTVLLLAFGENKADAVAGAAEGPITASNPASILQMHRQAKIYLDEPSASKLARGDYYRWVFENKPDWQRD